MKPSELFPGAVVLVQCNMWDGIKVGVVSSAHEVIAFVHTDYRPGSVNVGMEDISPLPISPEVLRGLGFEYEHGLGHWNYKDEFHVKIDNNPWYYIDPYMKVVESTHQLQALALHLYGVELTWNQDEYEKAMKEDSK